MTTFYIAAAALAFTGTPAAPAPAWDDGAASVARAEQGRGQTKAQRGNAGQEQRLGQENAKRRSQGPGQARGQSGAQGQGQGQARGNARDPGQGQARGQSANPGQGQGQARGQSGDQGQPRARGQSGDQGQGRARGRGAAAAASRGRVTPQRLRQGIQSLEPEVRRFATSSRPHERMVAGAAARAVVRGLAPAALVVSSTGNGIRVLNREDQLLLDLDERRARDLGAWEMRRMGDQRPRNGSPAFCRSGEGHPVWGREWCIEKGFGLGGDGILWSRGTVDDVIFDRRPDRDRLDRGTLIDVVGDIVFNRLALHALSLGYDQPLTGTWVAKPEGPQLLRVYSGDRPVAELVDSDRDDRVEVLYVAQLR